MPSITRLNTLHFLSYISIRAAADLIALLPYRLLHTTGKAIGSLIFHTFPPYRKRALSNIALQRSLPLSQKEIYTLAKQSTQNLVITALEYAKLYREKDLSQIVKCKNPEIVEDLLKEKQGVIVFCGHQANWELMFLEGTTRMPVTAIGRPIQNPYLYRWVQRIRQKFGGRMMSPENAYQGSLKALRAGECVGIVGDQSYPKEGIETTFLGLRTLSSPMPALLSYRTNCPIVIATVVRNNAYYTIQYSKPYWPNRRLKLKESLQLTMNNVLTDFEKSVLSYPEQWMWQHNRFKQSLSTYAYRKYHTESLLVIFDKITSVDSISKSIRVLSMLYDKSFVDIFVDKRIDLDLPSSYNLILYEKPSDLLKNTYRYKVVIDLTDSKRIRQHYMQLSANHVVQTHHLINLAIHNRYETVTKQTPTEKLLTYALCRREYVEEALSL